MSRTTNKTLILAAAAAAIWGITTPIRADNPISQFGSGDIVVLRGGDANTSATGTTQAPLYLDDYSLTYNYATQSIGVTYSGTVNVPSTGGAALTVPGTGDFQHEGILSLSTNGQYLTFAGYQVSAGSADAFGQTGSSQYQPVIGMIGKAAASLTTNTLVNSYDNGSANPYIRGAVSNDGNEFWAFGKYAASAGTSNGGLSYVSGTGPTATTATVEGFADWRDIVIGSNGQMYGGTGSSSVGAHGPYIVGNTVNSTTNQINTPLTQPTANLGSAMSVNTLLGSYPGGQSASALALLDLPGDSNAQNGLNVLYTIGDQSTAGITKYYFNGTSWINQTDVALNATNVINPTGLIAKVDPSNPNWVDLIVTGTNGIYTYIDESGYNGAIASNAFSLAATPQNSNEQFFGTAPAPSAVPEPATLGVLTLAGASLLLRRRK